MAHVDDGTAGVATTEGQASRHVFVSYSSSDNAVANELVRQLELVGVPCWIAPRDVPPGADFASQIIRAIRDAGAVIFFYSQYSNHSKHCLREIETAVSYGVDILPVRLDATPMTPGLEYRLSTIQWVDWRAGDTVRTIATFAAARVTSQPASHGAPSGSLPDRPHTRQRPLPVPDELVGREREVAALLSTLDAVVQGGTGRMVLVGGESGIGKSALVNQAIARAAASGVHVCATTCGSFLDEVSFFPVREILRQLTEPSGDTAAFVRQMYGPTSQQANMAAVVDSPLADAGARREATIATFANVVFGVARQSPDKPLLLFIDDMESIDPGSVDSLHCLLARIDDGPVMVVGSFRDDETDRAGRSHPLASLLKAVQRDSRASLLKLGPLPKTSYVAAIGAMLGGPVRLPANVVSYLWDQTEGNVLFLRELVRALSSETAASTRPCLVQSDGTWVFRGALDEVAMPRSVEEAIEQNLEVLAAADRGYLETASVIGKQFKFDLAVDVIGADSTELLDALERCVAQSILRELREPADSFEFSHNRVRDVLYNALSNIRRRRVHSTVADALLAAEGGYSDSTIGEHLYRAERFGEAAQYLYRSAISLMFIRESQRAASQLRRVAEICEAGAGGSLDLVEVNLKLLQALREGSEYVDGVALATRMTQLLGIDDERLGRVYGYLGDLERARGRIVEALAAFEQAESLSRGHPELELEVCADLHELHDRQRERTAGVDDEKSNQHGRAAEVYLDREVELAERVGGPWELARAYRNRAKSLRREGRMADALSMYEKSLAQTDHRVASHQMLISYGKTLLLAGRPDDAAAVVQRVYEWSTQTGARRSEGIALFYRAMIEMERSGATEAALRDLDEALAIHEEIGYDRGQWEVHLLRGEWFAMHDDRPAAIREFRAGIHVGNLSEESLIEAVCAQLNARDEQNRAARLRRIWSIHGQ